VIIGIDPGSSHAAVVAITGPTVFAATTLTRGDRQSMFEFGLEVVEKVQELLEMRGGRLLRIEDVNRPNPHLGMTNPQYVMDTSRMIGQLWGEFYGAIEIEMVAPGGHGRRMPLREAYPPELIGPRETTGSGKSRYQHARAAYDVAYTLGVPLL